MTDFRTELFEGTEAEFVEDELMQCYAEAFAEPPYRKTADEVSANTRRFRSQVKKPGFRAALARAGDGEPAGMAYGYPLAAGTGWWDTLTEAAPAEMRREDGKRTFGLFELAVRPTWRRRGVAGAVHRALLNGVQAERVLLNTRPEAEAAQAAYRAWGYRKVGEAYPWQGAAQHDVMVLDLT